MMGSLEERVHYGSEASHAANSEVSRNRRIDSRKPAIWFQLGMLGDAIRPIRSVESQAKMLRS